MGAKTRLHYVWPIVIVLMWFYCNLAVGSGLKLPTVKIGVLAFQGKEQAVQHWQPTIKHLNQAIKTHQFQLVTLDLQQIVDYVDKNKLDFVITNTGNYVTLAHKYGISRLATLISKRLDKTTTRFGAVIITHADRDDIQRLEDLKGKSFIGVYKNGFGGFQMAWGELIKHGISPFQDFSKLKFSGFPQSQVLEAVLNKEYDAGTIRSGLLENLASNGKINLSKIKILNQQDNEDFPFLHSTALFPEWPFAKLKHTPEQLARKVSLALLTITEDSNAASAAGIAGWTVPLNYKPANDLMKELQVGPYENMGKVTIVQVVKAYWPWMLASLIIFIILFSLAFSIYCLNSKLRMANRKLGVEILHREKLAKKLQYKATHDSLTNIYNRRAFKSFVERELLRCQRHNKQFAIMLIDINEFKSLNDNYGHQFGDEILKQFAKRVQNVLQSTDVFSRIGGDEFAVLCYDIKEEDIALVTARLLSIADKPYKIDGISVESRFSIGSAIYPNNGKSIKEMYVFADHEMYRYKNSHGE